MKPTNIETARQVARCRLRDIGMTDAQARAMADAGLDVIGVVRVDDLLTFITEEAACA